jgi:peptidoglycan/xylan/chitin deacetylase (PgdA/CDA1 family)/SAM-dependent methyltransferase
MTEQTVTNNPLGYVTPLVSIVIPAFQAADTLDRALNSLRDQVFTDWEAIVVDDGSTDDTYGVAQRRAASDPRIRVFRQENKGASAARNVGLAEACGQWLGFLDSDDWLAADFLSMLVDISKSHPEAGVVYCDFALVDSAGTIQEHHHVPDLSDAFMQLGRSCVLSVHCALTRADIMALAGIFDEMLEVNEDWDLWQRIARTGTPFRGVGEALAFYLTRPNSLSRRRLDKLAEDGITVIDRICRPEPRMAVHDARYANGLPIEEKLPLQLDWLIMCAGNMIALDEDPAPLLGLVPDLALANVIPVHAAEAFVGGLSFALCVDIASVYRQWDVLAPRVDAFWDALADATGQARACATVRALLRFRVLGSRRWVEGFASDVLHVAVVDIANPLPTITTAGPDAVMIEMVDGDTSLGLLHMPAPGPIAPAVLAETILAVAPFWANRKLLLRKFRAVWQSAYWAAVGKRVARLRGWGIKARARTPGRIKLGVGMRARLVLVHAFRDLLKQRLRFTGEIGGTGSMIDAIVAEETSRLDQVPALAVATQDEQSGNWGGLKINSPAYWDEVFAEENPWAYDSPYEQTKYEQTLSLVPTERPKKAIELACAEGHFTVQLASLVDNLMATDISQTAIERAAQRCAAFDHIAYDQLDFFNNPLPDSYDLIVCSEVLYECHSIDQLRSIGKNISDHLLPGGSLVMAHIIEAAEERDRSGFDWDGVFGSRTIGEVFGATAGLRLDTQIETELYRIHRFRKIEDAAPAKMVQMDIGAPPKPEYGAYVVWGGAKVTRKEAAQARAVAVPVLMYHRIAAGEDGPAGLAQYCVTPEAFEAQLRWLRQNGYHGISPADLLGAIRNNEMLPGKPVVLTFDDGYRDFATQAWPLLQHYGLPATVAVVTDKIGGVADWDSSFGTAAPLMNWEELQMVHAQGAGVASHSASHRALTALGGVDLLREAVRSREALRKGLGEAPEAIIYPYGIYDPLAARAFAMTGYQIGFGTDPSVTTLLNDPMNLPRIEVNGFDDLDKFIERLTEVDTETGVVRAGTLV